MNDLRMTYDYDLFKFNRNNRVINLNNRQKLFESLTENGFIKSFPLTVKMDHNDDKLEILDGQHRFVICKKMNLPVYYVIIENDFNIAKINSTSIAWTVDTYIESYCKQGLKQYIDIKNFKEKHGFSYSQACALLAGTVCHTNVMRAIKNGTYKIKDLIFAEKVAKLSNEILEVYEGAKRRTFLDVLYGICKLDDIDLNRLVKNCKKYSHLIKSYTNRKETLRMLEEIYNYKRSNLYPLAINVLSKIRFK